MSAVATVACMQIHADAHVHDEQSAADATPHDATPDVAIAALLAHEGPILLDLDETLYLRNSTEDFIDTAQPGLLALLLMRALDVIKPWRFTGGEKTRDVWRVTLVCICFPWVSWRWRRRVDELAKRFTNEPLFHAIKTRTSNVIIATVGFQPIVRPLITAMGLPQVKVVSTRLFSFDDRRRGKFLLAVEQLGQSTVHRALVITDSIDDAALLDACAHPLRVIWPKARYRRALSHVYLPGQYLTQVKRPGERYIIRGILQEDFAFWILSSIALAAHPLLHVAGLLFLLSSFWAVYERGYVSNDLTAARFETQPKLSAAFKTAPVATPRWQPWLWATVLGTVAIVTLRWPSPVHGSDFVSWAAVLLSTYIWFELYNRFDKKTRVWLFIGLQFARIAAFVALVPIVPIAVAALGAHALAKWTPYYVYRLGNRAWPEIPFYLLRLVFFLVLGGLLAASQGVAVLWNLSALALLLWNLYRARSEFKTACSVATRLDRTIRSGAQPQ